MMAFLKALRRGPATHREVFAEFAVQLVFLIAAQLAARRPGARLRVVR
jgi:hypothetical protein